MSKKPLFNAFMQIGLVGFTMFGFALTAFKLPQYGLISNLISEVFWMYSSYRAWKEADQIGVFITTLCITVIIIGGIINYWFI